MQKKYETRQKIAKVEPAIEEQFQTGRLLGVYFFNFCFIMQSNHVITGDWYLVFCDDKIKASHFYCVFVLITLVAHDQLCHSYSEHILFNFLFRSFYVGLIFYFLFLACLASRPGQCGRADGYVLEGKELEFYMRKIKSKKAK